MQSVQENKKESTERVLAKLGRALIEEAARRSGANWIEDAPSEDVFVIGLDAQIEESKYWKLGATTSPQGGRPTLPVSADGAVLCATYGFDTSQAYKPGDTLYFMKGHDHDLVTTQVDGSYIIIGTVARAPSRDDPALVYVLCPVPNPPSVYTSSLALVLKETFCGKGLISPEKLFQFLLDHNEVACVEDGSLTSESVAKTTLEWIEENRRMLNEHGVEVEIRQRIPDEIRLRPKGMEAVGRLLNREALRPSGKGGRDLTYTKLTGFVFARTKDEDAAKFAEDPVLTEEQKAIVKEFCSDPAIVMERCDG